MPSAEGYVAALNDPGAYRIVHLAPGQELSMIVTLNDWVDISQAEQYRLVSFFYPRLRGAEMEVSQADTVLDLTVLPKTDNQWMDQLDETVRSALISRDLDPLSVVRETFENRSESKFNRAILYLDIESLARSLPAISEPAALEMALIKGSWKDLPGLDQPAVNLEMLSSQVFKEEAIISLIAAYETYGERFERSLRIYLHKKSGYWSIRRIETLGAGEADDTLRHYGSPSMSPPEVVFALIQAAARGDWDIVFRYYDINDLVRNLPEYANRWKDMSSTEHNRALADHREKLISGEVDSSHRPLSDLEDWEIISVNYTDMSGSVVVRNAKVYSTNAGLMKQRTLYTFRLSRVGGAEGQWMVVRYDTARIAE